MSKDYYQQPISISIMQKGNYSSSEPTIIESIRSIYFDSEPFLRLKPILNQLMDQLQDDCYLMQMIQTQIRDYSHKNLERAARITENLEFLEELMKTQLKLETISLEIDKVIRLYYQYFSKNAIQDDYNCLKTHLRFYDETLKTTNLKNRLKNLTPLQISNNNSRLLIVTYKILLEDSLKENPKNLVSIQWEEDILDSHFYFNKQENSRFDFARSTKVEPISLPTKQISMLLPQKKKKSQPYDEVKEFERRLEDAYKTKKQKLEPNLSIQWKNKMKMLLQRIRN